MRFQNFYDKITIEFTLIKTFLSEKLLTLQNP